MPAQPQENVNGACDLEALRQKAKTRLLNDPVALAKFRKKARKKARQTLLEKKFITEEDLEALTSDETMIEVDHQ